MGIINKHITLDEIEIIRNSLDKLHEYHNSKSKFFSGDYPRITFEERIEEYKKIQIITYNMYHPFTSCSTIAPGCWITNLC